MKRAFLLALLLVLPACSDRAGGNTPPKAPPPVPIAAGPVVQRLVPVQVIAVGNVQAYTSVGIKSRVAGQVLKVHFKEGDEVREGNVLFTIDPARLNLGYTTIRAPIDGRAGNVLVQAGNVVKGNDDNPIVVLNQVHPIYLSFSVPEQFLGDIKKYRALGLLKVQARLPNRVEPIATGDLTFINNTVDPGTGTIQLKATFTNADNVLWPGQFLDAVLTLTSQEAIVVPSQAIQPGQKGPYVFVVKDDQTVDSRQVQPGTRLGAETIIVSGLQPGERVVIDGQLRLRPGTKVDVKTQ